MNTCAKPAKFDIGRLYKNIFLGCFIGKFQKGVKNDGLDESCTNPMFKKYF